ncbi:MAG TPA: hypothetical protein VK194_00220, partial [Candidatus Deferrimicrobium sp.]|nr:hypothetical protein [Candidatus Deferrimicrobium sp.]
PARRRRAVTALVVTGGLSALSIAPWLLAIAGAIRRNGGVALDSADTLLPARIGFWEYPREFGLILPLALVGAALVLVHLRDRDSTVSRMAPRRPEGAVVLIPWFVLPWVMAVLYDPGWPLEDALRPQRLWLLSSQPAAILAAIGLVALAHEIGERRRARPRLAPALIVAIVLATALPTVAFTLRQLSTTWTEPVYAHLRLDRDRVPDMAALLGRSAARSTVLAYEDWSSLVWYETGRWVVAVEPPGYAKLAFDPSVFTGHAQGSRRQDVARAFRGDVAQLAAVADTYGADRIILARRGDRWGLVHQVAAVAAGQPGAITGAVAVVDGNGWDAVELPPGARLSFTLTATSTIDLELRLAGVRGAPAAPDRRFRLVATGAGTERVLGELVVPATTVDAWQVVDVATELRAGERLTIEAVDDLVLQSIVGFVPAAPPPGWQVVASTADAVVLGRLP